VSGIEKNLIACNIPGLVGHEYFQGNIDLVADTYHLGFGGINDKIEGLYTVHMKNHCNKIGQ
jgi:hypothetical protein